MAWQPLLASRVTPGIEPIQFALAGMNAHINHDLPIAVVAACSELVTAPTDGCHHEAYQKVDKLLDASEQSVREPFEPAGLLTGALARTVAMVSRRPARRRWGVNRRCNDISCYSQDCSEIVSG